MSETKKKTEKKAVKKKEEKTFLQSLAELFNELKNTIASQENPYYHSMYTPLNELLDYIKPILNKHGFVIVQKTKVEDGQVLLVTDLTWVKNGEILESVVPLPVPDNATPQQYGIAKTYMRRYQISLLLGIASEVDDDANALEDNSNRAQPQKRPNYALSNEDDDFISEAPKTKREAPSRANESDLGNSPRPELTEAVKLFREVILLVNQKKMPAKKKVALMKEARANKENPKKLQEILDMLNGVVKEEVGDEPTNEQAEIF